MELLAISGSLRRGSSNTMLLRAARSLAPNGMTVRIYEGIADLPYFTPDLEGNEPYSVLAFRKAVQSADGLLFSTPEYAHGIPGVLKNALDWLVASGETSDKPFALLNASSRSKFAQASLIEVLTTMNACHITEADATVHMLGKTIDDVSIANDSEMACIICISLNAFAKAIAS